MACIIFLLNSAWQSLANNWIGLSFLIRLAGDFGLAQTFH